MRGDEKEGKGERWKIGPVNDMPGFELRDKTNLGKIWYDEKNSDKEDFWKKRLWREELRIIERPFTTNIRALQCIISKISKCVGKFCK